MTTKNIDFQSSGEVQRVSDELMWKVIDKLPNDRRRWGALYLVRVTDNGKVLVSRLEPPPKK